MSDNTVSELSRLIKNRATDLGFELFGIAPSHHLEKQEKVLREWCASGMHDKMCYLCRRIENRVNPSNILPGARSVIVVGLNYYQEKKQGGEGVPVLSRYAYGEDYHHVILPRLKNMLCYIGEISPGSSGRCFVDSSPLLEKAWAVEAGLGWQGRNSLIINPESGSFFFIGIILTDAELEYNRQSSDDLCGACRLCIEKCPTGAINENRTINAGKCISNLTINADTIPPGMAQKMGGRIFGCDICQEVCPWNKSLLPHKIPEFNISEELASLSAEEWISMTESGFNYLFKRSVVKTKEYGSFIKNVRLVADRPEDR